MTLREKYLLWSPRIIALAFAALLALFALDAFSMDKSLGEQVGGFLIHLLPAFATIVILTIAWKYRVVGGFLFLLLGIVFTFYFGTTSKISTFLLISAPLFAAGILFLISAKQQSE